MGKVVGMAQGRNLEEEETESEFAFISRFGFVYLLMVIGMNQPLSS